MKSKYYKFNSKNALRTLAASPVVFEKAIKEDDWSPKSGRHIFEKLIFGHYPDFLDFPLDFIVTDGREIRDVVEMRYPHAFLISEKLKTVFENSGLTGWRTYDVVIHKKNGELLPGYFGFSVIGENPVDDDDCQLPAPDFFRLKPDWLSVICTQKVVDVLKENKIKVFETSPVNEDNYTHLFKEINFPK